MALIAGFFIDKFFDNKYLCLLGMVIGTCVCYLFGTSWLAYQAGLDFKASFLAGVLPFIPGDLIKIVIAAVVGTRVRRQLRKAGINVSS